MVEVSMESKEVERNVLFLGVRDLGGTYMLGTDLDGEKL